MENFYLFEVLEKYEDKLLCFGEGIFYKGERFIGWESKGFNKAFKSNMEEITSIPLNKVKKVYKIEFEKIEGE